MCPSAALGRDWPRWASIPVFGARPLKRAIQQRIENPLSKLLLEGQFPPKSVIAVSVNPVLEPGVFQFSAAPQG